MLQMPSKWIGIILALTALIVIFRVKLIRVLLPEAFDIHCWQNLCVEDVEKRNDADQLLNNSIKRIEKQYGLVIGEPKIIFCSTKSCLQTFGMGKKAGFTFGVFGIVIAPRGWKDYYVSHELIHYWQAKNFGSLVLIGGESWIIEGMAYSLSGDPRKRLADPFESYRSEFNNWYLRNTDQPLKKALGNLL